MYLELFFKEFLAMYRFTHKVMKEFGGSQYKFSSFP